jgi:predicted nucleic acid-binding protein
MVQFELVKWAARETVWGGTPENVLAFARDFRIEVMTANIAVRAAVVSKEHRLAVADSVIYATALATDADLLTCDAHFEGLPGVRYLPKRAN